MSLSFASLMASRVACGLGVFGALLGLLWTSDALASGVRTFVAFFSSCIHARCVFIYLLSYQLCVCLMH